jgi:hypothetical protein
MLLVHIRSRDGSVGIMMGSRLDGHGLNPGSSKIFVLSTISRSAHNGSIATFISNFYFFKFKDLKNEPTIY